MATYEPTIGMEVHAELKTHTKMFCSSKNDSNPSEPNVHVCPVCLAHPGTLPKINREAVRAVLRVGVALQATLADYTEFDRKNYFYPDLPKGYQVSQYEYPLVSGGELAGVAITRVHLEEDTASSVHDEETGTTLIDFNRAGVPLMELVTEPVIRSAEEAGRFGRELQLLLRYLGVSDANMEKGEMRVEANVSVGKDGVRGTKVEIKNLNSFNAMERAVRYEIDRQTELLERGEAVIQETRGWNERTQKTFTQRIKEGSADYRYFPDPDLPSLRISEIQDFAHEVLQSSLPETPQKRRERYEALGIKKDDAALYVNEPVFGDFFDVVARELSGEGLMLASNYLANDMVKLVRDFDSRDSALSQKIPVSTDNFVSLIRLLMEKKISSRAGKEILALMVSTNDTPEAIAKGNNLFQSTDEGAITVQIERILSENDKVVSEYRAGKEAALEFLVGQSMRALRGAADPGLVRRLITEKLG